MDKHELEALIGKHARQANMTPEELVHNTVEVLGMMKRVDLAELLPKQLNEFADASRRIAKQREELRERVKNGARRTSGNIRLPV